MLGNAAAFPLRSTPDIITYQSSPPTKRQQWSVNLAPHNVRCCVATDAIMRRWRYAKLLGL